MCTTNRPKQRGKQDCVCLLHQHMTHIMNETPVYYFHFPTDFFRFRFHSVRYTSTSDFSSLLQLSGLQQLTLRALFFHLSFDYFDQQFCASVPRKMALCREFKDDFSFTDGFSEMKICFWTCSSPVHTSLVTTLRSFPSTHQKNPHTTYQPKTLTMQT